MANQILALRVRSPAWFRRLNGSVATGRRALARSALGSTPLNAALAGDNGMRYHGIVAFAIAVLVGGCASPYDATLMRAADSLNDAEIDGLTSRLSKGGAWYMSDTNRFDGMQRGIVLVGTGEVVRFAFLSHHLADDRRSHSVFVNTNYCRRVTGGFCCEVLLPSGPRPKSVAALDVILKKFDDREP